MRGGGGGGGDSNQKAFCRRGINSSGTSHYIWLIINAFSLIFQVGILDVDLFGPSIQRHDKSEGKRQPVFFWVSNKIKG